MVKKFTWKNEKLKSRTRIERVFKEGKSFSLFPYRVYFLLERPPAGAPAAGGAGGDPFVRDPNAATPAVKAGSRVVSPGGPLQAGFSASRRNFKKAVDRNRIKRLSREAYRLQKEALLGQLREKGVSMAVFFIYTGRELPDHATVTQRIGVALHKLIKEIR
ncbi:MAG: ribonuclease P protein component [Bacteroidetes bacterium]|nr:ribonuclease P protein component [Bacteroidota bacterium]